MKKYNKFKKNKKIYGKKCKKSVIIVLCLMLIDFLYSGGKGMKYGIVFFSGTGNTKFVAKQFKKNLEQKGHKATLVDISENKEFHDEYEGYIFGGPLHAGVIPDVLESFIMLNIKDGKRRKTMVFSTQASQKDKGTDYLAYYLERMNFDVVREEIVSMPNNYYAVMFKKADLEKIQSLKRECIKNTKNITNLFLRNEEKRNEASDSKVAFRMWVYKKFRNFSKKWAKKKLSVDMNKCTKCKKCEIGCITQNIKVGEVILFGEKCISCQRCLHSCPTNAILYKKKIIDQYKV